MEGGCSDHAVTVAELVKETFDAWTTLYLLFCLVILLICREPVPLICTALEIITASSCVCGGTCYRRY